MRTLCLVSGDGPSNRFDKRGGGTTNASGKAVPYSDQLRALHIVASATRRRKGVHGLPAPLPGLAEVARTSRRLWGDGDDDTLLLDGLSVNSDDTPIGLGGYDRPLEHVENIDEIAARYRESGDPTMYCAYCGDRCRTKKFRDAIAWFRTHECLGEGEDIKPEPWQWPDEEE